jgi:hypothetical protein
MCIGKREINGSMTLLGLLYTIRGACIFISTDRLHQNGGWLLKMGVASLLGMLERISIMIPPALFWVGEWEKL